ncbi:MAG: fibronectin type III domain-containing protein [Spirochaetales bacterium]|nr:fibronectin type III domain-containing protein [Spirochaetales bacterium]
MKTRLESFVLFICLLAATGYTAITLASCPNPMIGLESDEELDIITGNLVVSVGSPMLPMTVTPSFTGVIDHYEITGDGPGTATFGPVTTDGVNPVIIADLVIGDWVVTVVGVDSGSHVLARGESGTVTVSGTGSNVTVSVSFLQEATGAITIDLSWEADAGIDSVLGSLDDGLTEEIYVSGLSANYIKTGVASGFHAVTFTLKSGADLRVTVYESVHVYDYLTSSKTIPQFTESDFSTPPAPSNIGISLFAAPEVALTWDDSAIYTESGFVVERSVGGSFGYAVLDDTLSANTGGFTDTSITEGEMYWYRVKAINSFGSSPYTDQIGMPVFGTPVLADATQTNNPDIVFEWQAITGAAGYEWEISDDVTFMSVVASSSSDDTANRTYTLSGAADGVYYWHVKVKDSAAVWTEYGATWSIEVDTTAPSAISGVTADATYTSVTLNWTNPSDTDLDRIDISWLPADGDGSDSISDPVPGTTDGVTIHNLNGNTAYAFTIATVDFAGNSADYVVAQSTNEFPVITYIESFTSASAPKTTLWTPNVNALALVGNDLYAGHPTVGGISFSKTDDACLSWSYLGTANGFDGDTVRILFVEGTVLWATSNFYLYKSTDCGSTWTDETPAGGFSTATNTMYADGSFVAVGCDNGGIVITTDGGSNWTTYTTANGLIADTVTETVRVAGRTWAAYHFSAGLSYSDDDGATWNVYPTTGLDNEKISDLHVVDNSTVYVATNGGGIGITTDGGINWTNIGMTEGLPSPYVYQFHVDGSYICADTSGGLAISNDGGSSWTTISGIQGGIADMVVVGTGATAHIYLGTATGLGISANGGSNWSWFSTEDGLPSDQFEKGIYAYGTTLWGATNSTGVVKSTDGGSNFTVFTVLDGLGTNYISDIYGTGSSIFLAMNYDGCGFTRTLDGGATWETFPRSRGYAVFVDGNYYYYSGWDYFWFSSDAGTTWSSSQDADGPDSYYCYDIYADADFVVVGTENYGVGISNDFGSTWTHYDTTDGLSSDDVFSIAVSGSNIWLGTSAGISVSADGGANWGVVTASGAPTGQVLAVYVDANGLYAGAGAHMGIYISRDFGTNWVKMDSEIGTPYRIYSISSSGYDVYLGTDQNGIIHLEWR